MNQLFKETVGVLFFGLTQCIPERQWVLLRDRFACSKRRHTILDGLVERIMNKANRMRMTKELIQQRVTYFPLSIANRYIYEYVFRHYGKGPVDYLEFGVADGGSMRVALANLGPEANLYGFDSFEGLPEQWYGNFTIGTFSREGGQYQISPPRISRLSRAGLKNH